MSSHEYVRRDAETAEAVSRAMKILAEYGYIRARAFFNEAGVRADLAERMLLIRYDRRRPAPVVPGHEEGVNSQELYEQKRAACS